MLAVNINQLLIISLGISCYLIPFMNDKNYLSLSLRRENDLPSTLVYELNYELFIESIIDKLLKSDVIENDKLDELLLEHLNFILFFLDTDEHILDLLLSNFLISISSTYSIFIFPGWIITLSLSKLNDGAI